MNNCYLGLDIGGTKTAAGIVDATGRVLFYVREPTPQEADAEELLRFVVSLAEQARQASQQTPLALGVGCGGPMLYPAGVVSPLHIPAWRSFPLRERLQEALGLPTVVDNDAKALALGEAIFGAGQGARCLLGMVVSTGVGGGIVVDGKLFHGASGNAGHIGHVIAAPRGPRCECGAIGCLTVYAAGTGIAERAKTILRSDKTSRLAQLSVEEITGQAVVEAAQEGDALAARLIYEAGLALGRAIASTANLFNLDRVVIGGGITGAGDLLFVPLRQELRQRATLDFSHNIEVYPAALGSQSGVIGAASLVIPT